jgi:hypothetical protein
MADYPSSQYGPASAGAGGGGSGGPVPGNTLVLLNGLSVDVSGAAADGLDPCAVVWPAFTVGDLIAEYPADATLFDVIHPVRGPEGPFTLTDTYQLGSAFACDDVGTIAPLQVVVGDGVKAGVIAETYILFGDINGLCVCGGP